jgi:hypothetical protein
MVMAMNETNNTVSKQDLHNGFETIRAIADAIRELGTVPAGTIYAVVMGKISLEAFEKILGILKGAQLIEQDQSSLLRWIGPK